MPSVKNIKNEVVDLTNGPTSYTENDGRNLSNFVENPVTVKGGPHGTINVIKIYSLVAIKFGLPELPLNGRVTTAKRVWF